MTRIVALPLYAMLVMAIAGGAALLWLHVDRVVAGRGVLTPPENSIKVAAPRAGVVEEVLAQEGQFVKAGEALARLDDRDDRSAIESLEAQVAAARLEFEERARLLDERRRLAETESDVLARQRQAEALGIETLRADARRLARETERWELSLARKATLAAENALSQSELEEAILTRDNSKTSEAQNATTIAQREMHLVQLARDAERAALVSAVETKKESIAQLEGRRNLASLERQLAEARLRLSRTLIAAPADGVVHALALRGQGDVVAEGNLLCRLVPKEKSLLAEVELPAADVGFVKVGQPVKVKLDAFPFEDYGAVGGRVEYVAADADLANDADGTNAPGAKRLPVYTVRVRIDAEEFARRQAQRSSQAIEFRPGMTLTAELVERRESLGAMLFRPLRKASRGVGMNRAKFNGLSSNNRSDQYASKQ